MRRKRKRTTIRPAPVIVILLIVNIAVGLTLSRLTVIRHIEIVGARDWERPRLESIAQSIKGRPCAQINPYVVESLVLQDTAIKGAQLDRNLFGDAVLTLEHEVPVARFYNHLTMGIGEDGVVYESDHFPADLPTIELGENEPRANLTLANDFPSATLAHLAQRVRQILPRNQVRIEYGTGSSLCLNIGTDQIFLGSCEDIDLKLDMLQQKLSSEPDFLSKIKSFNLLYPKMPMTVPK
jgi:hypothetical protein